MAKQAANPNPPTRAPKKQKTNVSAKKTNIKSSLQQHANPNRAMQHAACRASARAHPNSAMQHAKLSTHSNNAMPPCKIKQL